MYFLGKWRITKAGASLPEAPGGMRDSPLADTLECLTLAAEREVEDSRVAKATQGKGGVEGTRKGGDAQPGPKAVPQPAEAPPPSEHVQGQHEWPTPGEAEARRTA